MPTGHRLGALTCAVALLVAAPAASGQAARGGEVDAHYLVLEWDAKEGVRPKFHRLVKLARPPASLTEAELAAAEKAPRGRTRSVSYRVKGRDGKVAFRGRAVIPRQIRGEFHGQSGEPIEGVHFEADRATFVVRVPRRPEHETLVIEGAKRTSLDLRRMEAAALGAAPTRTRPPSIATSAATGDPSNRVDIVLLGDGYTAAEEQKFFEDAARVEARFFGSSPYAEYRSHVNFTALFTASEESGADHPPYDGSCALTDRSCCLDPTALGDPLAGRYVETAFGARYCNLGTHRLLVVDNTAELFEAASQVPDWDELIVLVNDPTYGGSGGLFSVLSNDPSTVEVVQHEFAHSFSGLADEYDLASPIFGPCSDLVRNSCQANVTDETRRERIKWGAWIDPSTPLPTPIFSGYEREVGLFEGAFYMPIGMYRPREDCAMRSLGAEFCEVCRQTFVLRLYRGGWGVPARGIDPIEPGSESPPPGAVSSELCPLSFSADLLEPAGGPPLDVGWFVDGVEVATGGGAAFDFSPPAPGRFEVDLRVRDVTPFVHPELRGRILDSTRRWSVDVSGEPCPGSCSDGPDGDADGVDDECDVCPLVADTAQGDADGDGIGDACECGDANGDGWVDPEDARLVQRCAAGAIACSGLCDVTSEGVCNTIDARLIQRFASGRLGKADLHCAERP